MPKNLLIILGLSLLLCSNLKGLYADEKELLPIKKPVLTSKELEQKISINILKPLAKPLKEKKVEELTTTGFF